MQKHAYVMFYCILDWYFVAWHTVRSLDICQEFQCKFIIISWNCFANKHLSEK